MRLDISPAEYPRRILLVVTGLSPQVLTESLFALATREEPFVPTEVHAVTTGEGAAQMRHELLSERPGWFRRLVVEWAIPEPAFGQESIHVICNEHGQVLADIRSADDNVAAANTITRVVQELTSDPKAAVHVSIAGGRKTLGFFGGYALSLFGREQDRLSHVLVSAPFESNAAFFFPRRRSEILHDKNGSAIDARDAEVVLAEIPFVRLRVQLEPELLARWCTFDEAVETIQRRYQRPRLTVKVDSGQVWLLGEPVQLQPKHLAFYTWLALRQRAAQAPVTWREVDALGVVHIYRQIESATGANGARFERAITTAVEEFDTGYFNELRSRVNARLFQALRARARPYRIQTVKGERGTGYGLLGLEPKQIEIHGLTR